MDRRLSLVRRVRARNLSALMMAGIFASCAMIPTSVDAQQIYKWTDSNGQTHYSDHAPTGQAATTVDVPTMPPPKPAVTLQPMMDLSTRDGTSKPAGFNERSAPADPEVLARNQAQSHTEAAARKNQADKELVARCKSQRDTDCNQVDEIKKREAILNEPPPPRWRCYSSFHGVPPSCEWVPPPQTKSASTPPATKKKKSTSKYTIEDN